MNSLDRALFKQGIRFSWATFLYYLSAPDVVVTIAEISGELVGFCIVSFDEDDPATLVTIDVAEEYWRRGVGAQLMNEAHRCVESSGAEYMALQVAVGNAGAISFYETFGYLRGRLIKRYYGDGSDAFEMIRRFQVI